MAAHRRRAGLDGSARDHLDCELTQLIREIDDTISSILDIPAQDAGIGERLSRMAERWVIYAESPDTDTSKLGLLKAQCEYNAHIEQLPLLRGSTR
ncbi:hypothetical protein ACIBJI_23685 [Nocardia sp. NPDC050408]|uniref:hypothetical protein n=1 Tax=Nocardia sp. NPDC050408 TaxID=3364319 RepID=UPI00379AFD63